jgi:hypothetical protein
MLRWVAMAFTMALMLAPLPARAVETIDWKALVPQGPLLKDPLTGLTQDQRFDLETIAWVRTLGPEERKLPINSQGVEDAQKFERKFKELGIDIDKLLEDYAVWQGKVEENKKRVVAGLDGKQVRIAGYLLPLEFSEEGNTEFLLVPYVGACIHVPPPPANQIVFVSLKTKFVVRDLYTPVWLTGTIKTKASSKALTLVDGASNVSVGYHIDGDTVEPYKKE